MARYTTSDRRMVSCTSLPKMSSERCNRSPRVLFVQDEDCNHAFPRLVCMRDLPINASRVANSDDFVRGPHGEDFQSGDYCITTLVVFYVARCRKRVSNWIEETRSQGSNIAHDRTRLYIRFMHKRANCYTSIDESATESPNTAQFTP
jgi:hypothetical protein